MAWCDGCQRGQTPNEKGKCNDCGLVLVEPLEDGRVPVIEETTYENIEPEAEEAILASLEANEPIETTPTEPKAKENKPRKKRKYTRKKKTDK